jgi:hypothetical protein
MCRKQLSFWNRKDGERGAWEVCHKIARARGASDLVRNLVLLCWACNRKVGTLSVEYYIARSSRVPLDTIGHPVNLIPFRIRLTNLDRASVNFQLVLRSLRWIFRAVLNLALRDAGGRPGFRSLLSINGSLPIRSQRSDWDGRVRRADWRAYLDAQACEERR